MGHGCFMPICGSGFNSSGHCLDAFWLLLQERTSHKPESRLPIQAEDGTKIARHWLRYGCNLLCTKQVPSNTRCFSVKPKVLARCACFIPGSCCHECGACESKQAVRGYRAQCSRVCSSSRATLKNQAQMAGGQKSVPKMEPW